jgi:hypothetical protein
MTVRPEREPMFLVRTSRAESPQDACAVRRDVEALSLGRVGVHP